MKILTTIKQLQDWRAGANSKIGLVPTMGALHNGHLSLVNAASQNCDLVLVSIFVNPIQFAANEDLSRYPRPFEKDCELLENAGVDVLFAPNSDEIYPQNFATKVSITNGMDKVLCGAHRAGHFDGVCTIVALLFSLSRPQAAFFGEKDFQQLSIIRQMNNDLHLVPEIIAVPTMREADGLAMSSRNQYLSLDERKIAAQLYATLITIKQNITSENLLQILQIGCDEILAHGFASLDYLEVRDPKTLEIATNPNGSRLFVAATLGKTRLIDNILI